MLKKIMIIVVAVVLFSFSFSVYGQEIADVDQTDPAYEAVKILVEKGYLPLYEGDLFRGDRTVDRFTLATVIANLLIDIQEGRIEVQEEDEKHIRELTVILRQDLVQLAEKLGVMEQEVITLKDDVAVVKQGVTDNRLMGISLEAGLDDLVERVVVTQMALKDDFEAKINIVNARNEELMTELVSAETEISKLKQEIEQLDAELTEYKDSMDSEINQMRLYIVAALLIGLIF